MRCINLNVQYHISAASDISILKQPIFFNLAYLPGIHPSY